jgi:hypothetical protein
MPGPAKPADPAAIVRALNERGVSYVMVGGWAAVTYGVDRATFDLDVVVDAEADPSRRGRDQQDLEELRALPDPDLPHAP